MIKSIQFKNFKVLRDCTLPLSQFTLLIGPNGSGKSTALAGVLALGWGLKWERDVTVGEPRIGRQPVEVLMTREDGIAWGRRMDSDGTGMPLPDGHLTPEIQEAAAKVAQSRVFSLDARLIPGPVKLPQMTLGTDGAGLAGVLDNLRDQEPERWEALNEELHFWMPEFDRITFETSPEGMRSVKLRMTDGGHMIPAPDLSQGTLLALAILTIAYTPNPPLIVGLEEPDRGLHPRLLRVVRDAMYRLAYPEQHEGKRPAVQVIATTHSPYMLDQFKDHPEEIVIANRVDGDVKFERLSDRPDLDEILKDSVLGDAWYSGILGGVPAHL